MNTTARNTKSTSQPKLNKGPFAKFVNRKNDLNKSPVPIAKPKAPITVNKK